METAKLIGVVDEIHCIQELLSKKNENTSNCNMFQTWHQQGLLVITKQS